MKILIVEDERPAMDAMILLIHKAMSQQAVDK